MNCRCREATHSRTERSRRKGKMIKNVDYNVAAGTTMRKVKNFKIFDAHRGMPNTGPRGKTIITRALVMWLRPRTLEDDLDYPLLTDSFPDVMRGSGPT
jgi:hypothetical protein